MASAFPLAALPAPEPLKCSNEGLKIAATAKKLGEGTETLVFSHRTGRWVVCIWSGSSFSDSPIEVKPQLDDKPRLLVQRNDKFAVFLADTNAMLFGIEAGKSTEKEADVAADLQKLVGLLGAVAGAGLESVGSKVAAIHIQTLPPPAGVTSTEEGEEEEPPKSGLAQISEDFNEALDEALKVPKASAKALADAATPLKRKIEELTRSEAEIRTWIQRIDWASPSTSAPAALTGEQGDPHDAFQAVRDLTSSSAGFEVACADRLAVFQRLIEMRNCKPNTLPPCGGTAYQYNALLDDLDDAGETATCSGSLQVRIDEVSRALRSIGPTNPVTRDEADFLEAISFESSSALAIAAAAEEARHKAIEIAAGEAAAQKTVDYLGVLASRFQAACDCDRNCKPTAIELDRKLGHRLELSWNKVRTETFSVAKDPQLKEVVSSLSADAKFEYELARIETEKRRFALDYALLYTEVADSTFTAVAQDPKDPNNKTKLVGVKERDTRAGEPVLFLTWANARSGEWATGPQFGVAVDSSKPAVYLGWSLRWRFLGLGAGFGAHRLTTLDGQVLGAEVTGNDDIKTKKEFETSSDSWYVSLTVSLTDLPFFKNKS